MEWIKMKKNYNSYMNNRKTRMEEFEEKNKKRKGKDPIDIILGR